MKATGLFCFQKNLCATRKYSSMCSLTPHYCTKQPRTYTPLNTNRALFPMQLSREHVAMESFLLTSEKNESEHKAARTMFLFT